MIAFFVLKSLVKLHSSPYFQSISNICLNKPQFYLPTNYWFIKWLLLIDDMCKRIGLTTS